MVSYKHDNEVGFTGFEIVSTVFVSQKIKIICDSQL